MPSIVTPYQRQSSRVKNVPAGTSFVVNHLQGLGFFVIKEYLHDTYEAPISQQVQPTDTGKQ